MPDRVKVFEEEEKKKALPIWAWLVPLLLLLALLFYFLTRHHDAPAAAPTQAAASQQSLGTVYFDTDQAELTSQGKATVKHAADLMIANPGIKLRLQGYTDSTGNGAHNGSLSERRAIAVGTYLKAQGINGSRLSGQGFGPEQPAATNGTDKGKADNRRVELYTQ